MLAVRETDRSCLCSSFVADMPRGQMRGPKEKRVYAPKKPPQNPMNQQKPECRAQVQDVVKKAAGRRRGRGRGRDGSALAVGTPQKAQPLEVDIGTGPLISSKGVAFPRRPGYGQAGTKCIVKANHFLARLPDKDLNQYDVRPPNARSSNRFWGTGWMTCLF